MPLDDAARHRIIVPDMRIGDIVFSGADRRTAPLPWLTAGMPAAKSGDAAAPGGQAVAGLTTHEPTALPHVGPPPARVMSLVIEAPALHGGSSGDLCLKFSGGFQLRLQGPSGSSPENGSAAVAEHAPPLDHVTVCVYADNLDAYVAQLRATLPAAVCERYRVGTDHAGMMIAAISDPASGVQIVLAAPVGDVGQVAEFLANTGCEGLQHLAFSVPSVHAALHALQGQGLRFVGSTPGCRDDAIIELREEDRWLRQAFTEPVWGEFFIELVERKGITGLHPGNIQALYDMNEQGRLALSDVPVRRASG